MSGSRSLVAVLRSPGPSIGNAARTFMPPVPIDAAAASVEHRDLVRLLHGLGVHVVLLPADLERSDACFVEDPVLILDEAALLLRMGAHHRRGEGRALARALAAFRPIRRMTPPGTLEGGDVLRIGRTLLVGRSVRTDAAGVAWVERMAQTWGYEVRPVEVSGALHLKTACGHAGGGVLLVNPEWVDTAALEEWECVHVPPGEAWGANVLEVNGRVLVPAGFTGIRKLLQARGRTVVSVEMAEIRKAEAGLTCLVLLFEARG